jgi:ribosome maturation factor RimP
MSEMTGKILQTVEPYAKQLGLKISDIEFGKKHNGINLTVFIYKDDGAITLDDCERLHKLIDAPLDELNPTNDKPYTLNVTSVGLDRPLKKEADFLRNIGKELEIKFYAPQGGKKLIEGVLTGFDGGVIHLKTKDGNTEINLRDTAKVTLKINF